MKTLVAVVAFTSASYVGIANVDSLKPLIEYIKLDPVTASICLYIFTEVKRLEARLTAIEGRKKKCD